MYDLSNGLARVMSQSVVGKQVDIIPHTGVVVDWGGRRLEYFFGGGICVTPAGAAVPMEACEVLDLGTTSKSEAELLAFLRTASPRFTAATYDLLTHNCNHFSDEVARFPDPNPNPDPNPDSNPNPCPRWLASSPARPCPSASSTSPTRRSRRRRARPCVACSRASRPASTTPTKPTPSTR